MAAIDDAIDALTVEEMILIQKEETLGVPSSLLTREAAVYRKAIGKQIKARH